MEGQDERREHNDVLFVSTTTHLAAPFLAGMARVRASRSTQSGQAAQGNEGAGDEGLRWRLDTRYYSAELQLVQVQHSETANVEASVQTSLPRGACDAFLLLCDAAEVGTGAKLQAWQTMLEDLAPSVQLCVASATGANQQHEGSLRAIEDWCTENAVELILWNPLDEGSSNSEATGGLLSERQGLERVLEALEANMWPAMTMKPRTGFPRYAALPDEEGAASDDLDASPERSPKEDGTGEPSVGGDGERKEVRTEAQGSAEPTKSTPPEEEEEGAEEKWTEELEEHFDKAFQQLAGLREIRQQSAQMSDEQRRDFAADAALALARAFGLDLDDDSDSD